MPEETREERNEFLRDDMTPAQRGVQAVHSEWNDRVRASLELSIGKNLQSVAESENVAKGLNLPSMVVEQILPKAKDELVAREVSVSDGYAKWVGKSPRNAAVARSDNGALGSFFRFMDSAKDLSDRTAGRFADFVAGGGTEQALWNGLLDFAQSVQNFFYMGAEYFAKPFLGDDNFISRQRAAESARTEAAKYDLQGEDLLGQLGIAAVEQVPQLLAMMMTAGAVRGASWLGAPLMSEGRAETLLGSGANRVAEGRAALLSRSGFDLGDNFPFRFAVGPTAGARVGFSGMPVTLGGRTLSVARPGGAFAKAPMFEPSRWASMGLMGAQIAGGSYGELRDQGVSQLRAMGSALLNAVAQTPLESIGFERFLKIFKSNSFRDTMIRTLGASATEFTTEFLQQWPEFAAHTWALAETKAPGDPAAQLGWFLRQVTDASVLYETFTEGLLEGGVGALLGFGGGAVRVAASRRARQSAVTRNEMFRTAMDLANETDLKTACPDVLEDVIDSASEGVFAQSVYFSPRAALDLKAEGTDVLTALGISEEEALKAEERGVDLEAKMSSVMARLDAPAQRKLGEILKDDPAAATVEEAASADDEEEREELVEQAKRRRTEAEKARAEENRLAREMTPLVGGWNARLNARFLAAHANAFANAYGVRASDVLKRMKYGRVDPREAANAALEQGIVPQSSADAVRARYEGTQAWMKAPNGQATKLTEAQWCAVRTPEFKRFFGDWENDPENASKVLDENGEPLVVYHVTSEDFDAFDLTKARQDSDVPAFYFSSGTEDWGAMGDRVVPAFLNLRNPKVGKPAANMEGRAVREQLEAGGYDGTIETEEGGETEYAVFNPEQIKSAQGNVGAFDPENPNIFYQESTALPKGLNPQENVYLADLPAMLEEHRNLLSQGLSRKPDAKMTEEQWRDKTYPLYARVKQLLEVPGLRGLKKGGPELTPENAEEYAEKIVERLTDNLTWVYEVFKETAPELMERASMWYDGAQRIMENWARRYGISKQAVAGVIACLSPQKDWFANVTMAERVLDIVMGKRDARFDDEMKTIWFGPQGGDVAVEDVADEVEESEEPEEGEEGPESVLEAVEEEEEQPEEEGGEWKPSDEDVALRELAKEKRAKLRLRPPFNDPERRKRPPEPLPETAPKAKREARQKSIEKYWNKVRATEERERRLMTSTLGELLDAGDYEAAAWFVRAYDQAHNTPFYNVITPEGGVGGLARSPSGRPMPIRWQSYGPISKAVACAADPTRENIGRMLGDKHKVRNFENNIRAPWDPRFATIDTHAVAAALVSALSSSDVAVNANFGSGPGVSTATGIKGSYPIYLEAYRRAAERAGILPRQMQSITWEGIRTLYMDTFKSDLKRQSKKTGTNDIEAIWKAVDEGTMTREAALAKIKEIVKEYKKRLAGNADAPLMRFDWSSTPFNAKVQDTYNKNLTDGGPIVAPQEAFARRTGAEAAGTVSVSVGDTKLSENEIVNRVTALVKDLDIPGKVETRVGASKGGLRVYVTTTATQGLSVLARAVGRTIGARESVVISDVAAPGLSPCKVVAINTPTAWGEEVAAAFSEKLPKGAHLFVLDDKTALVTGATPEDIAKIDPTLTAASSVRQGAVLRTAQGKGRYADTAARIAGSFAREQEADSAGDGGRRDPLTGRRLYGARAIPGRGFGSDGVTVSGEGLPEDPRERGQDVAGAVLGELRRRRRGRPDNGESWSYARTGAAGTGGLGLLTLGSHKVEAVAEVRLQGDAERLFSANGMYTGSFYELAHTEANGQAFHDALAAANASHGVYGKAVSVYKPKDYAAPGIRCFLSEDGLSGFAVKDDGAIVSVFNTKVEGEKKYAGGRAPAMLEAAISMGGRKLDCYDTVLPSIYSMAGFRAVYRIYYNDSEGPEGWPNEERMRKFNLGRPDVVFMVYDENWDGGYLRDDGEYVPYDDYTAAGRRQEAANQLLNGKGLSEMERRRQLRIAAGDNYAQVRENETGTTAGKAQVLNQSSDASAQTLQQQAPTLYQQAVDHVLELLQRAWTGSPNKVVGKLTLTKIGSGEGGAAHGWGLYFAQQREISQRRYRERLIEAGMRHRTIRREYVRDGKRIPEEGLAAVRKAEDHLADAVRELRRLEDAANYGSSEYPDIDAALEDQKELVEYYTEEVDEAVAELGPGVEIEAPKGTLLEVEIPESDILLDEQLPFRLQPKKVQEGLRALSSVLGEYLVGRLIERDATGEQFYEELEIHFGRDGWDEEAQDYVEGSENPSRDASLALNGVGIPGLTYDGYLDGRCFVIWDDTAVEIINKYEQSQAAGEKRGQVRLTPQEAAVTIFKGDMSTIPHESAHIFVDDLKMVVEGGGEDARDAMREDLEQAGIDASRFEGILSGAEGVDAARSALRALRAAAAATAEFEAGLRKSNPKLSRSLPKTDVASLDDAGRRDLAGQLLDAGVSEESAAAFLDGTMDAAAVQKELVDASQRRTRARRESRALDRILSDFIRRMDGLEQAKADMRTLRRFANVPEEGPLTVAQETEVQEYAARGFEQYLSEGKSPTPELDGFFARMKQWLKNLYSSWRAYVGAELTDDVRRVFDRMLATEAEARTSDALQAALGTEREYLGEADLTEEERREQEELLTKAEAEATAKRDKALKRDYNKRYRACYETAKGILEQDPFWAMILDYSAKHRRRPGEEKPKGPRPGGINKESLARALNPEMATEISKACPGLVNAQGGGESVDVVCMIYARAIDADEDSNAFANRIYDTLVVQGRTFKKECEAMAEQMANEETGQDEAVEDGFLAGDAYGQYLEAVQKAQARLAKEAEKDPERAKAAERALRKRPQKHYDALARREVEGQAASRLSLGKWTQALKRALADRSSAVVRGKPMEAVRAMDRARFALSMMREVKRARDLHAEVQKKVRQAARAKKGNFAAVQTEAIRKLAAALGFPVSERAWSADLQTVTFRALLERSLGDVGAIDLMPMFPDWLRDLTHPDPLAAQRGERLGLADLTVGELRDVANVVDFLVRTGKDQNAADKNSQAAKVQDLARAGVDSMSKLPAFYAPARTAFGRAARWLASNFASVDTIEWMCRKVDAFVNVLGRKGATEGRMELELYEPLRRAMNRYHARLAETNRAVYPHVLQLMSSARKWEHKFGREALNVRDENGRVVEVTEAMKRAGDRNWKAEMVIALALNLGNAGNRERILGGFSLVDKAGNVVSPGLTYDTVSLLLGDDAATALFGPEAARQALSRTVRPRREGLLSAEDWRAVQAIWNVLGGQWAATQAAHKAQFGFAPQGVDPEAFSVTVGGERVDLAGGYYPIKYDPAYNAATAEQQQAQDIMDRSEGMFAPPTAKRGFTMQRVQHTGRSLRLGTEVLQRHLDDSARFIELAQDVRFADLVTRDQAFQGAYIRAFGLDDYASIRPNLKSMVVDEPTPTGFMYAAAEWFRSHMTYYVLGLNLNTAILQLTAAFPAMGDLGVANFLRGLGQLTLHGPRLVREVWKASPYMERRYRNIDADIARKAMQFKPGSRSLVFRGKVYNWSDVANLAMMPIGVADATISTAIWCAAYHKRLGELMGRKSDGRIDPDNVNHTAAVEYADRVVAQSNPDNDSLSKSAFARDKGIVRLFNSFTSATTKFAQRSRYMYQGWRRGQVSAFEMTRTMMFDLMLTAVAMALIKGACQGLFGGGDDDEKKEVAQLLGQMTVEQFAMLVPVFGNPAADLATAVFHGETTRRGGGLLGTPVSGGMDLLKNLMTDGTAFAAGEDDGSRLLMSALAIGSYLSMVPGYPFGRRVARGLEQWEEGRGTPMSIFMPRNH